ncbi:MAG: phosphomannomutase/phosphoglucomutase [Methylomonas sp.]|jgi:phosphomannomutase/phosphoglucomutase|uniref:phosphomannomutase/phosphoglucomutase n=1 Tax=Methylomonas sp. TaxID=418 RepID=UPI0025E3750D|nr:phosphomannomutase/phosphoglucomutase [Methylomonas sp.]MCK9608751.1 phosphomannomutase/phosphoglucomutase [Methylomonas sp.]
MGRIFSIIAAISALMVLIAGVGTNWFSAADARTTKKAAATLIANNLAVNLGMQLNTLQATVDGLAQTPDVIAALSSGNPDAIRATEANLQTVVPYTLRLRLIPPNINDLDQSQMPHMGYGDLEMVRATLTSKPQPVIQGDAEHRHLAITSAVRSGQQVAGVILASLKPDLLQQLVTKIPFDNGLIELKQDQLVLATIGQTANRDDEPISIPISNSRWQLNTWANFETSLADIGILTGLIGIPALLACLAFFIGYRKFSEFFRHDQSGILNAAKDMLQGKTMGSYPMQLDEMQPIIAAMVQFKRVMDQQDSPLLEDDENKPYDFFDESFDIDFLEETKPATPDAVQTVPISTSAIPVAMPDMEKVSQYPPNSDTALLDDGLDDSLSDAASDIESWDMPSASAQAEAGRPVDFANKTQSTDTSFFRTAEIRGSVGHNLDEEIMANIGRAFASEARQLAVNTIVVGRDGRSSSPAFSEALIKGITSAGCDVLDIGLVPTPVLYFVSHHSEGRTGLMVTGGHFPADQNGLKITLNGEPLSAEHMQSLKSRIAQRDFAQDSTGAVDRNTLFSNEYIGIISEDTHIVRPMTIVVDSGNGATGELGPMLLKSIGCDVVELYCDIDGRFPNHQPDPGNPANLDALIKAVKLNNADAGIAFDGDGDCMTLVDSNGRIIWADRLMMLFARDVLAIKPGSEIIYDAACSSHLPEQIKKRGGYPVLCKNGTASLQNRLRETGAALAGDLSGHFLFNDRWFGFNDALYAAVRIIEILSADMRSSSELFDDLPDSLNTPELHVILAEGENVRFMEQLISQAQFPDGDIITTDGMRVEFPDGWGLVRASDSSADLILRFEASSREALSRIQAQFKLLILKINPAISLPF